MSAYVRVEKKRHFEFKKRAVLVLSLLDSEDTLAGTKARNESFFFPAVLCNHLSSLSTSSVVIGPHPLTQDSLLFEAA